MRKIIVLLVVLVLTVNLFAIDFQMLTQQCGYSVEKAKIEKILRSYGIITDKISLESKAKLIPEIFTIEKRSNCASLTNGHYLYSNDFSQSFYIAIKTSESGSYYYAYRTTLGRLEQMISSSPEYEVKCLDEKGQERPSEILYQGHFVVKASK